VTHQAPPADPLPHAELNRQIASSILACFPPQFFDATGQLMSVQQLWLMQSLADVQGRREVTPRSAAKDPAPHRRFDLS
jgi:hypothetical protein